MSNTGWESLVNLVANVAWVSVVYVHLIVYLDQFVGFWETAHLPLP